MRGAAEPRTPVSGSGPRRWTRRGLLFTGGAAGAWAALGGRTLAEELPAVRLGWWPGREGADPYEQGLQLGVEEAERLAGLLGTRLELSRADGALEDAIARLGAAGVAVVLAAASPAELASRAPAGPTLIAIEPGEEDAPVAGVLRVGWPRSWRVAALAARAAEPERSVVVDWHPALERFGAGQLNERYLRRFGAPMGEAGWRAWIAVKCAAEAVLRGGPGGDPAAALRSLVLDGHHGKPLRFSAGGLLLHPAYLATDAGAGPVEATLPVPAGP